MKIRSLLEVNEEFSIKADAKRVEQTFHRKVICCGYFEAARRVKIRSLLVVNEEFSIKADAKIAEQITLLTRN